MKAPRKASPGREPSRTRTKAIPQELVEVEAPPSTAGENHEDSRLPDEVLEFVSAIDEYKRQKQRPFPNWSEVLGVLKSLGYQRDRKSA
jgi:hypothetical protein